MPTANKQMQGKVCLITGATSGIGKATAIGLASMGASLVLVVRDKAKGEVVQRELQQKTGNENIDLLAAELSSQASIHQLAEAFKQKYQQLHVLINNAGLFEMGRRESVDGVEMTLTVNYLAPFLLTNLLLDTLKASTPSRIINVSSDAQAAGFMNLDDLQFTKRYRMMAAYSQSKVALVLFTYELARRLQGTGVTANCLHPGFVKTNIGQGGVSPFVRPIVRLIFSSGISPEEGAKTSIYLASSPDVATVTGKYFIKGAPKRSAPITYDQSVQRRLWDISTQLVKLPEYSK